MSHQWYVKRTNPEFVEYLSRSSSISPITAQILINRGIKTPDEVRDFLSPHIGSLSRPDILPGMERAISRIRAAALQGERVLIHGDYDADGVTSTAIMMITLGRLGIQCDYFIPNRFDHGYGFNRKAIESAKKTGTALIITVDCGINSFDETAEACRSGIDVIVTDHHEPLRDKSGGLCVPEAHAVINPKLMTMDRQIPVCGAGIALMMAIELIGIEDSLDLFDLAAIGTVADMVPLRDDNRIIIKKGLQLLNSNKRESLAILREVSALRDKSISTGLLSYSIIPRINASGRLSDASEVVRLFLSEDRDESHMIARTLNITNSRRQKIEELVMKEALAMLRERPSDRCIVLHGEGWHEGVIGIVASKIADIFQKPVFIFSVQDGIAKGSARSIADFDLCLGLSQCAEHLISFGGHKQAAGLTLKSHNIADFERTMNSVISGTMNESGLTADFVIDAEVSLEDITLSFLRELSKTEPFGPGNEEPIMASKGLEAVSSRVLRNNHLKLKLRHNSITLDAIGFNMGSEFEKMDRDRMLDAVFVPTLNEWNGSRSVQLNIKALRPAQR